MFPTITHINDILSVAAMKPEIRVIEHIGDTAGYKTIAAMIGNANTYDSNIAREFRGIVFYPDGKLAARPLHKFFNVGERSDTQEHVLDLKNVSCIFDKRDGSMIYPVPMPSGFKMKTKKSFESDAAIAADKFAKNDAALTKFVHLCIDRSVTPIFEFTSPKHRIVLNYQEEKLCLLHIRENVSGRYFSRDELAEFVAEAGVIIPIVDTVEKSFKDIKNSLLTIENIEGYVLQFNSGDMVKLKTKWYLDLHHTVTFPTQRSIAGMVLDETIDDYKSYLTNVKADMSAVQEIENKIINFIGSLRDETECAFMHFAQMHGNDRKAFATAAKAHHLFGLIMVLFNGREVDYTNFYKKNFLASHFTTEQV